MSATLEVKHKVMCKYLAGQLSTVVLLASIGTVELETEELISFFAPNYHYALHEALPGLVAGG